MNCRKRAKSMIEQLVKEINICLENECFLSALGMALTLPDICGKAEYPTEKYVSKRYINWFNTYVSDYEKPPSPYGDDMPYLSGEVLFLCEIQFFTKERLMSTPPRFQMNASK